MSIGPNTKATIAIEVDLSALPRVPDDYLVALWHAAQFNPAPFGDELAGELVKKIGWEIIRRWLAMTPPSMYHHQPHHYTWHHLTRFAVHRDGNWQLDPDKVAKHQAEQQATPQDGCPRNVIDGDAGVGQHFFKKGALSDSPIACVYCGAHKPEGGGRQ